MSKNGGRVVSLEGEKRWIVSSEGEKGGKIVKWQGWGGRRVVRWQVGKSGRVVTW